MAQIRKDDKQMRALEVIKNTLNVIKNINAFLDDANNEYTLSFTPTEKSRAVKIVFDDKKDQDDRAVVLDAAKIDKILADQKDKLVRKVDSLSKKYQILLENADLKVMGLHAPESAGETPAETGETMSESLSQ